MALCTAVLAAWAALAQSARVEAPPDQLRERLKLPAFYAKHVDADGIPVIGSAKVSDFALLEAAFLIRKMLEGRPEIRDAIAGKKLRFTVMAATEMTTDVPEHSDLTPKSYWDRRARGLGATLRRPATSCGEENLLGTAGDPYAAENILIHEFGHTIHEQGLPAEFDRRVRAAHEQALKDGLWKGTYASTNHKEYWAEGVQSWFDTNRERDREHNDVNTRDEIKKYDPRLSALLAEVFGDGPWRYVKPAARAEPAHLAGFDVRKAPRFQWPKAEAEPEPKALPMLDPSSRKEWRSSKEGAATTVLFENAGEAEARLEWIDAEGGAKLYATLRPGDKQVQSTFAGHVWRLSDAAGRAIAMVVAESAPGKAVLAPR